MEILILILSGVLFATAIYNLLQKQLLRIIIGTILLSHGAHLIILTMGKLKTGQPPVLMDGVTEYTDPLPQALILTSIVISFGITGLLLVLAYRTTQENNTDNMEQLRGGSHD
ncbi:Na(+)/H(+) antiporter subunit C [Oceanobacillus halophilus]|uniref:Na(+)/H(+) antiporter subunit C n=1 Tax=Oceanobacillus halophilus TaxID=930130 RepID=A0A495AD48_9BACI|nr:Na(+)/H(+) antiporter subunit C [Oceanobacillus halophilus]RKQ37858.1 Na(+)/H(+) antiporter subunit C [Oceanobacillus halophilus]